MGFYLPAALTTGLYLSGVVHKKKRDKSDNQSFTETLKFEKREFIIL